MGRRKRAPADNIASIWFHPRFGIALSVDHLPRSDPWREIAQLRVIRFGVDILPEPGQQLPPLPRGFLWADPARQRSSYGMPHLIYGPLEQTCRTCRAPFVFTAGAQRGLYEDARADLGATQVHCPACIRKRRALEQARGAYAEALHEVEDSPSATAHFAFAQAALRVLEAGGRVGIDRAIGHVRTARKLGATGAAALEKQLLARRGR